MKNRNLTLAYFQKTDPTRFRERTEETAPRKIKHNRAKGKQDWKRQIRSDFGV